MKLTVTNISSLTKSPLAIEEKNEDYFTHGFHTHPEFELVYITKGFGKRIIGNKIEEFKKGELLIIGPNVPHVWITDKSLDSSKILKAIVVYFNPKIFADIFYQMEEARQLTKLFMQAQYGIEITGITKKQTVLKLKKMLHSKGFNKLLCLFDMLNNISLSTECISINRQISEKHPHASDRLTYIFDYINSNFTKDITLKDAAKSINLTPESFCRYFKQKTGKRFIDYLHETRVFYASQSLLNTDMTIAEISYKTGFTTVSNFNKLFKRITGYCPAAYRKASA